MEASLTTDFAAAWLHLDRAYHYLSGDDDTSRKSRAALDLLLEAIATAQYSRPRGKVVQFPRQGR
ncbi:hypothetical protein [Mesorhizobium sp. BHbdii]